jgi:hypothetical protein
MRKYISLFIALALTACGIVHNNPTPTEQASITKTTIVNPVTKIPIVNPVTDTPIINPVTDTPIINSVTETPLVPTIVDASTMEHKLLMGYQGWFSCPSDGSNTGWFHWFTNDVPATANFRVDMYPDASELTPSERCPTPMKYPNGDTAYLYSAYNTKTVRRHFQWMSQYDIDGVFLQRFVSELPLSNFFNQRNVVTQNVRAGAEAYGRVFAIEYDISNNQADPNLVSKIETDWKYLVDVLRVTESPSYVHHKGKPVLGIYGLGLNLYKVSPQEAMELVNFFENNPDPKYQVTLMGGVPGSWRTLNDDSLTDPAWAKYYCALNIISPWTVGRFSTDAQVDLYKSKMTADMGRAKQCGAEYMPVVFPGTAFHNTGGTPFNQIPRRGGNLYWRQVYNVVSLGAPMIFNAMFDEVDEDTAMYKIAATTNDQPVGVQLISMDVDGIRLPNDWYLRLGGAATKMLRGDIPLTPKIPLNPDGSLVTSFPTLEATPQGLYHIRVQITTSADWTTFSSLSGGVWNEPVLVSASPESTNASIDTSLFALNQSLDRAKSGKQVAMVVDVVLSEIQAGQPLTFEIKRGSIGMTTVTLMNFNRAAPVKVKTIYWAGLDNSGLNPMQFTVPANVFMTSSP